MQTLSPKEKKIKSFRAPDLRALTHTLNSVYIFQAK